MKDKQTSFRVMLCVLTLGLLLTGCRTVEEQKEAKSMEAKLKLYGKTVRWGALENLYGFLTPEQAAEAEFPENLNNVRVTDYQVRIPAMLLDEENAAQTVTIEYLFRDTQVIKTMSDKQLWKYDPEVKDWFRDNPIPEFK